MNTKNPQEMSALAGAASLESAIDKLREKHRAAVAKLSDKLDAAVAAKIDEYEADAVALWKKLEAEKAKGAQ